jgi:hypothetical protein
LGYQVTPNVIQWSKGRASGIENVSSVAAGRLLTTARDALVFAAPEANRLNLLDVTDPNTAAPPSSFHSSTIGPNLVVALDIGGLGNTAHDDLFVASRWNNGLPNLFILVRDNAGTLTELSLNGTPATLEEGSRVVLKSGQPILAGVVRREVPANTFLAYRLTGGGPVIESSLGGLPPDVRYAWGQFNVSPLSQFVFYVPNRSNLWLRPVQEPVPGTFAFGPGADFALDDAIGKVITLTGSPARLLVLFASGARARVYDFDGVSAPVSRQEFNAGSGETFTGAGLTGGGNYTLYSSRDGTGRSTFFQSYNFNGSSFVAGSAGALPPVSGLSARGNVVLFQREPFVAGNPNLLRTLNAGDWSSQLSPLPGPVSVQSETFGGASQGLANPTATPLGSSPALAMFGLVNQYSNFFSLFSFNPAQGDEVSEVRISPAPGTYQKGIVITLIAADPSHQIFYRLAEPDPWTLYGGPSPLRLFKETTVQFYGRPPLGTTKSRIKSAHYTFTAPPGTLDSDGDGIPDYVEIARGLDPLRSGNDSDGDGYFDLDELLAGTNPTDFNDPPAATPIPTIERQAVFDLVVTPRPWDGRAGTPSLTLTSTAVRAYSLAGSLLAYGRTTNTAFAGVTNPAAPLINIGIEKEERLLAIATEEHFAMETTGSDPLLGRELIGLIPAPTPTPLFQVGYVYGGGVLSTEANNWLLAAAASNALTHRATFALDLTIQDTLGALLTERKLRELLLARGLSSASNLTLFSFRPTEASRFSPDLATFLSLESREPSNQTAYALQSVHSTIQALLQPGATPGVNELRSLTEDIYRLSSASNNAAPGAYPSPVDTLREFIATGVLQSNYLAHSLLSASQRTTAASAITAILAAVPGRPTTNIELRVRSDSFTGTCTVLETTELTPHLHSLFHPGGQVHQMLEAFHLVPGTRLQVFAHTDLNVPACAGRALEVISIELAFVPHPTATDLDGDLLPDDWETLFGVSNPLADDDGDGYSNLQELLEGTDPRDGLSKPIAPIADLSPPEMKIESDLGGSLLKLSWDWPEPYASRIKFKALATSDLGNLFTDLGINPTKTGGHFELTLPNPGTGAHFFQIIMEL